MADHLLVWSTEPGCQQHCLCSASAAAIHSLHHRKSAKSPPRGAQFPNCPPSPIALAASPRATLMMRTPGLQCAKNSPPTMPRFCSSWWQVTAVLGGQGTVKLPTLGPPLLLSHAANQPAIAARLHDTLWTQCRQSRRWCTRLPPKS